MKKFQDRQTIVDHFYRYKLERRDAWVTKTNGNTKYLQNRNQLVSIKNSLLSKLREKFLGPACVFEAETKII